MVTEPTTLRHVVIPGNCLNILRSLGENTVDAIVTDPPYGLGFMGKVWDALPPGLEWAQECLRVLKPGGHLLAFGGTRTWHRLAVAIEDAGFEIRDSIAWLYGTGFPKSLDVSKAIDKAAGATREVVGVGQYSDRGRRTDNRVYGKSTPSDAEVITAPATPEASQWSGWGTALKPAFEPIVVARKPLAGTVAANVLEHGTGALNIDGCRIAGDEDGSRNRPPSRLGSASTYAQDEWTRTAVVPRRDTTGKGRWPANVVLDADQAAALDEQSGTTKATPHRRNAPKEAGTYGAFTGADEDRQGPADIYGASRFFYVAKAPKRERPVVDGVAHPTVKPLALMRWLVRLVTPPGGIVLDPFAGSGTTLEAAVLEGFVAVGIEREADYLKLIEARMAPYLSWPIRGAEGCEGYLARQQ